MSGRKTTGTRRKRGGPPAPAPAPLIAATRPDTPSGDVRTPPPAPRQANAALEAVKLWASAYRVELALFAACFVLLACFSAHRFLRQSEAPHFVYQARAWLEGRLDIDPAVLPNLEDWACVREVDGRKQRCVGAVQPSDRWFVSFPWMPAVLMLPFVALNGYQLNDTSFTVFCAALAIAFFYSLLRFLSREQASGRTALENASLAGLLCFGTVFFCCAIRGEVWFTAEVLGVGLSCLYLRNAIGARRPVLAGLFFSMAVLTRTPLLFSGIFFLMECLCPAQADRLGQLRKLRADPRPALQKLQLFALGAAPLLLLAAAYNEYRFGSPGEFGHAFLYNNRVNADIDRWGLFNPHYLARNLSSALLLLPRLESHPLQLAYDPNGLSLLLTFPLVLFVVASREPRHSTWPWLLVVPLALCLLAPRLLQLRLVPALLLLSLVLLVYFARPATPHRLHLPLWLTVAACALPGLLYQNNGYMQFGFRFSLDYTPHLLLLFAVKGWSLVDPRVLTAAGVGVVVNFWGAVAFRGYTELMRRW